MFINVNLQALRGSHQHLRESNQQKKCLMSPAFIRSHLPLNLLRKEFNRLFT